MLVMCRCRVCGKEYEACHTLRPTPNYFRWQDVACSPECGAKYLAAIEASRMVSKKEADVEPTTKNVEEEVAPAKTTTTKKRTKKNKA